MSKEAILDDIQREAAENEARQRDMAELKPRARAMLLDEAIRRVEADRAPFRNELGQIVASLGAGAGPQIDELCDQYGRQTLPEVKAGYQRAMRVKPRRLTLEGDVEFMRVCGLPEPVILDYIAHRMHKTLNTRGGPRNEDEVRVKAAAFLLKVPLRPARRAETPASNGNANANARPVARAVAPPDDRASNAARP
jgi:hypothetical protein